MAAPSHSRSVETSISASTASTVDKTLGSDVAVARTTRGNAVASDARPSRKITLECYGLDATRTSISTSSDATSRQMLDTISLQMGVPRTQLAVYWGKCRIDGSTSQPMISEEAERLILHVIRKRSVPTIDVHFDSVDVAQWEAKINCGEVPCVLDVHVGSCHRMNVRYWQHLSDFLMTHTDNKILGLKIRQLRGYLHPDAVRMLGMMLPSSLESLDVSRVLPGSRGLELLAPNLPGGLTHLNLSGCVDDSEAFGNRLVAALANLRSLQTLSVEGNWVGAEDILRKVKAVAPHDCELKCY